VSDALRDTKVSVQMVGTRSAFETSKVRHRDGQSTRFSLQPQSSSKQDTAVNG